MARIPTKAMLVQCLDKSYSVQVLSKTSKWEHVLFNGFESMLLQKLN